MRWPVPSPEAAQASQTQHGRRRTPPLGLYATFPSQETAALQSQCFSSKPGSPLDAPLSPPHSHPTLQQQILLALPSKYSPEVRRAASERGRGLEQALGSGLFPELSAHYVGGSVVKLHQGAYTLMIGVLFCMSVTVQSKACEHRTCCYVPLHNHPSG